MADPICTRDSLISGSACFKNLDAHDRKALLIYFKVVELAGILGPDYVAQIGPGGDLNTDAAEYKTMSDFDVEVAKVVIASNNAIAVDPTTPTNIQTLMEAIKCLQNFDDSTLDRMHLFVECNLGRHKDYPQ